MNQDHDHLRLLAIFHFIVAGLSAVFSLIPIIHVTLGLLLALHPEMFTDHGQTPPPPFIGWILVAIGVSIILLGLIMAVFVLVAGLNLLRHKHYTYCLVMAAIECLFMPFGTILGIFTIIVLNRDSVKALFAGPPPPARVL